MGPPNKQRFGAGSLPSELLPGNAAIPLIRWSARILGLLLAGFFLFMFIAESFETRNHYPGIDLMTVVRLIPAFAYVVGMFLALKSERAGAKLAGASLGLLAIVLFVSPEQQVRHNMLLVIVGLAFSLPVILYGLCWWLEERDRKRCRAGLRA
jgi:hypothetical protein